MRVKKLPRILTVIGVLVLALALLVSSGCATEPAAPTSAPQQSQATQAPADQPQATAAPPTGSGATRDFILIGRPNPTTGPLAAFGEGTPWAEEKALEAINKDGGIFIKEAGKKLPVQIKVVDTESNPTKAAEVTSKLILEDEVDLIVVLHTPDTVNPVSATCERYQIPCISLDAPVEAWLTGGPYTWGYHAFWTVDSIAKQYMSMWDQAVAKDPSIKKNVGYLLQNDPDGTSWSAAWDKILPENGYNVVDTGRFPYGTKDYSSMINTFKEQEVEIVAGCMSPPDFATLWRQMRQQGFVPKVATVGKGMLFPSDAAGLGGDLALGICSEMWWSAYHPFNSSLTGQSAAELCEVWTEETGRQWAAPLGFKYGGMEIAIDVLTRAETLDKNVLRDTLAATNLDTIVGKINYDGKQYSETPLVGGQWAKGDEWDWEIGVINNEMTPAIPTNAEMVVPIPH